ncbi:hypothetical protein FLA_3443 [Filimonas lacunae]|nr:hypothetical protein FLA_3443 [Filimonas lacunae]
MQKSYPAACSRLPALDKQKHYRTYISLYGQFTLKPILYGLQKQQVI